MASDERAPSTEEVLDRLRDVLRGVPPSALEDLAAASIGDLLGVTVAVARSGFQHGADAGTVGRQDRRLRVEAKRYSDATPLSDRELLGEIDQASARDPALEAWILVATRDAPEQLEHDLASQGERLGVPVIVLDWKRTSFPALAALCASAPDVASTFAGEEAGRLACGLRAVATGPIARLARDLSAWQPGLARVREASQKRLSSVWRAPRSCRAALGQDAAGGAREHRIERRAPGDALSGWWERASTTGAPAVVVGREGVGKTWAALDWLVSRADDLPVVVIAAARSLAGAQVGTRAGVRRLLAERLQDLTGVRDLEHWIRRLDRMLLRPLAEGPAFALLLDGLNQEPSVDWATLLRVLQDEPFAGRVAVVATTRDHHFANRLSRLRGLAVPPAVVEVGAYDAGPGGELDRMLALEGLTRADLHEHLVPLAANPRLFDLVLRFRGRLSEAGQVTVHRLLWEYGRDTLGARVAPSFGEEDWRAWLQVVARRFRDGTRRYDLATLGETAARPDLDPTEVQVRLGDIVDGHFTTRTASGTYEFRAELVAHALGCALIAMLDDVAPSDAEAAEAALVAWLDPIDALDERSEVLRAAVSILLERDGPTPPTVASVLVTAWLQAQNLPEAHRGEVRRLGAPLVEPLLDAIERSTADAHGSARLLAVEAIGAVRRDDGVTLSRVVTRLCAWLATVSREVGAPGDADGDFARARAARLRERVGVEREGARTVLGREVRFVDRPSAPLEALAPSLLWGFPLVPAIPALHAAALALAILGVSDAWDGLRWLCFLNDVDPDATALGLRALAGEMAGATPEPGVHPGLPRRTAALLLWFSGEEVDEEAAAALDPGSDRAITYEADYLPHPGRSWFPLERRHAAGVLCDVALPLRDRVERLEHHWGDPDLEVPPAFCSELRENTPDFEVDRLGAHFAPGPADVAHRSFLPALARCAPDVLAELARRRLLGYADRPPQARHWSAVHALEELVLVDGDIAGAASRLRRSGRHPDQGQEAFDANQILALEVVALPGPEQVAAIVEAAPEIIFTDLQAALRPLASGEVDALVERHGHVGERAARDLVALLLAHEGALGEVAWRWLAAQALDDSCGHRGIAGQVLAQVDAARFGGEVMASGWSWSPADDRWVAHYRSTALAEASLSVPFDRVMGRLAPWCLLSATRVRGCGADEVRLAAAAFGRFVLADAPRIPDVTGTLSTDLSRSARGPSVFSLASGEDEADGRPPARGPRGGDRQSRRAAAMAAVESAWREGAGLYLATVDPADMALAFEHARDEVEAWMDGAEDLTPAFRGRVRRAGGAYVALCEAALAAAPERGAILWRALRSALDVSFEGVGEVDELTHVAFRAPHSDPVARLRADLLAPPMARDDRALLDVAVAARVAGRGEWLRATVAEDLRSGTAWVRARGEVLSGFVGGDGGFEPGAWPEGEVRTDAGLRRVGAARSRAAEAGARHWWRRYLAAADPTKAYAAWVLFALGVDRRAVVWMAEDVETHVAEGETRRLRQAHFEFNRRVMRRDDKRDRALAGRFLGREIVAGIGPWRD